MTAMALQSLLAQITLGEDSTRQFNANVRNAEFLASEIAAFANTDGAVLSGHAEPTNDFSGMEPAA